MKRRLLAALACAALASCGGDSSPSAPTRPSAAPGIPAGTEFEFLSGELGTPVSSASVTVAGRVYRSDSAGRVRLTDPVPLRSLVDVQHPDYLDRQTLARDAAERRFSLWPRRSPTGLDEDFTQTVVYTTTYVTDTDGTPGNRSLRRLPPNEPVGIRPSAQILGDGRLMSLVEEGVGIINTVVEQGIYRVEAGGPTSRVGFSLSLDPSDPYCDDDTYAFVDYSGAGPTINGGRIVYCEDLRYFGSAPASRDLRDYFLGTLIHELGHTFGLGHTRSPSDIMYRLGHWFRYRRDREFYSRREEVVMRLMWQRRPGTSFPDNDRDGIGSLARWREIVRN